MKCYIHTDKDAVGVCSVCGQGVCENCAVKIGNKLYCRECADKEFAVKKEAIKKPIATTSLAVLFCLGGARNLVAGVLAFDAMRVLRNLGYTYELAFMQVLFLAMVSIIIGVMFLVAAYYLWNLKRLGGLLGGFLVIFTLILNLRELASFVALPTSLQEYAYDTAISSMIGIVVNIVILVYLRKSWKLLQ